MTEINNRIDLKGMTLCYALFAYNDGLISKEVMDCYRDTFAEEICQLFPQPLDDKELREKIKEAIELSPLNSKDTYCRFNFMCPSGAHTLGDCYKCVIDQILALLQPKRGE